MVLLVFHGPLGFYTIPLSLGFVVPLLGFIFDSVIRESMSMGHASPF